jgi:acetyl esterase/lipase
VVRGRDGRELVVLVARPAGADGLVPVIYHVHGGGLVVGRAVDDLPAAAALAADVGMAVAAVEYRLAPEHPYPAASDDVYEGLLGLAEHAADWGIDPESIVLSGVSAGGGLAAATALRIRDQGGPVLIGQMLLCPMLDDRNDSASAWQMAGVGAWDRRANETGWSAYLGSDRREVSIYASPGRAHDLSGLPPTFLDVGSAETFRDEVQSYAARLWNAGGDAELHVWAGGAHGFDALVPDAPISRAAVAARASWLRRLRARATVGS